MFYKFVIILYRKKVGYIDNLLDIKLKGKKNLTYTN